MTSWAEESEDFFFEKHLQPQPQDEPVIKSGRKGRRKKRVPAVKEMTPNEAVKDEEASIDPKIDKEPAIDPKKIEQKSFTIDVGKRSVFSRLSGGLLMNPSPIEASHDHSPSAANQKNIKDSVSKPERVFGLNVPPIPYDTRSSRRNEVSSNNGNATSTDSSNTASTSTDPRQRSRSRRYSSRSEASSWKERTPVEPTSSTPLSYPTKNRSRNSFAKNHPRTMSTRSKPVENTEPALEADIEISMESLSLKPSKKQHQSDVLVEVYDIPIGLKKVEVKHIFTAYKSSFEITEFDAKEQRALLVFDHFEMASKCLYDPSIFLKRRIRDAATHSIILTREDPVPEFNPGRSSRDQFRPATSGHVAHRLVTHALGVNTPRSKQREMADHEALRIAKEEKQK